jgi:hypothetical protein
MITAVDDRAMFLEEIDNQVKKCASLLHQNVLAQQQEVIKLGTKVRKRADLAQHRRDTNDVAKTVWSRTKRMST